MFRRGLHVVGGHDTQTPSKYCKKPKRNLLFCWSDFGSFSDAGFVSNSKTERSQNPKIQTVWQDSVDVKNVGFLDFWNFWISVVFFVVLYFVFFVVLCSWYTFVVSNVFFEGSED